MKRVLAVAVLTLATMPAMAHWQHHGGYRGYYGGGWGWVAPAIIGGAVVYGVTRPETVIVQQPPIVVQNPPVIVQNQNCTPWTETQNPDGTITRTRTCAQ
jgi:hypothetical protein